MAVLILLGVLLPLATVLGDTRSPEQRAVPALLEDRPSDVSTTMSAADHYLLATWCKRRGHEARMLEQARLAIGLEEDHAGARALLGHALVGGRWLPSDPQALRGYVEDLQTEVNARFLDLVSQDRVKRGRAIQALLRISKRERIPEIAAQAERLFAKAGRLDRSTRASVGTRPRGIMELRLSNSRLRSLRNRTVGSGFGAPLSLQLPELQQTSIKTTAIIPLGGG